MTEHSLTLLMSLQAFGARVSHRGSNIRFDERNATLLIDKVREQEYGIAVGDRVMIDGRKLCPFEGDTEEALYDYTKLSEKVFEVVAFFRVGGSVGKHCMEGTFCALVSHGFVGGEKPFLCDGRELGRKERKVNLYWIGCLEKPDFLNQK